MTACRLEIRCSSQVLGAASAGGVWMLLPRAAPVLERGKWVPVEGGADRLIRLSVDGRVLQELPAPRLVRVEDDGAHLLGFVAREAGDAVVGARDAQRGFRFELRDASEWTDLGPRLARFADYLLVLDEQDAAAPCALYEVSSARRVGVLALPRTQRSFWAVADGRVFSSGATTRAFRLSGEPLWSSAHHASGNAGIAVFQGDLWLVTQHDKGHELVCLDGESGNVTRRSKVPPVHVLATTTAGLLVGHELGVSLVKARAGRPSTLLKSRLDSVATDGAAWAALDRAGRRLYLARSIRSTAAVLELCEDATLGEPELVAVSADHALLRPSSEVEDERAALLLGDERLPRLGRCVTFVPLAHRGRGRVVEASRLSVELVNGQLRARACTATQLGSLTQVEALTLSDAQVRLANALERYALVPKGWRKKVEAELLRDEHSGALGALLQAAFTGAIDKGHRVGFGAWEKLRARGATALISDFERLLRDEPIKVRGVDFDDERTSVVVARGREVTRHELGVTDDPTDVIRLLNTELAAAGAVRRFHAMQAGSALRAFLLRDPAETSRMKRGGLKGLGKPVE